MAEEILVKENLTDEMIRAGEELTRRLDQAGGDRAIGAGPARDGL